MKISVQELLIVLAIILIIFGPTQIPKLVKSIKNSSKEIKDSLQKDDGEGEELPEEKKVKKSGKKASAKVEEEEDSSGGNEK